MAANGEIRLGELFARVEFDTVPDDGSVKVAPTKVQLVLKVKAERNFGDDMVVLGTIETVS